MYTFYCSQHLEEKVSISNLLIILIWKILFLCDEEFSRVTEVCLITNLNGFK